MDDLNGSGEKVGGLVEEDSFVFFSFTCAVLVI